MNTGIILYQTDDGLARVQLRAVDGSVWLTQLEIAELFATTKQNVNLHAKNILTDGELVGDSVVKESLTTAADGKSYARLFAGSSHPEASGFKACSRWLSEATPPDSRPPTNHTPAGVLASATPAKQKGGAK